MDYYGVNIKDLVTGEGTPDLGTVGSPFGTLYGEATSAQWGDLAEKYVSKEQYERGTVISVSADPNFDVEMCNYDLCYSVVGIISTQPGFTMGDKLKDGQYVALTGLVPVKIFGAINKSDFIVATFNGCARAGTPDEIGHKIGVANETNKNEGIKLVGCIIK